VAREETRQYGIVGSQPYKPGLDRIESIVEKPCPETAPSTLAVVGRYVLNNGIFKCLEGIGKGAGGEIQLTDGIAALIKQEQVLAYRYEGRRYDCGSKLGYIQATVAMGLKHPELGASFARYLERLK
jgi:UTP--glucose-1-phosphate uridylyltransferase